MCLSVPREHHVSAPIPALLASSCPDAVTRRVGAIVVNTLNLVTRRRARSHVCQETIKVALPLGTHSDSTATIPSIVIYAGIRTAPLHVLPDTVLRCAALSMCLVTKPNCCSLQAAATLGMAAAEFLTFDSESCSALAPAQEERAAVGRAVVPQDGQAAKRLPRDVDERAPMTCHGGRVYHDSKHCEAVNF